MKKGLVFITLLFLEGYSYSQSVGINGSYFYPDSYPGYSYGFNLEYNKQLNKNFDYTLSGSILYASQESHSNFGRLHYFHIPVTIGIRYSIIKNPVQPYIALEGGLSYFSNEMLGGKLISRNPPVVETELAKTKKIYPGLGGLIGLIIPVSERIGININGRLYLVSKSYASFEAWNAGILYNL